VAKLMSSFKEIEPGTRGFEITPFSSVIAADALSIVDGVR
jgi:hypothetical protein